MDRKQMIKILEEKGFHARTENHILIVDYYTADMPLKEVKAILQENGYASSFGLVRSKSMTQYLPDEDKKEGTLTSSSEVA